MDEALGNFLALQAQNVTRLQNACANKVQDVAMYNYELDKFLRLRLGTNHTEIMAHVMALCDSLAPILCTQLRVPLNKWVNPEPMATSLLMTIADTLSFYSIPVRGYARGPKDYFGLRLRAPASMTQYRNTLEKLAQSLDTEIHETEKGWQKQLLASSAENVVAAIYNTWPNKDTRALVATHLSVLYDMNALYIEKDKFRCAWAESLAASKAEPLVLERKRAASKALSESQLDRVKALSATLAEKATTAVGELSEVEELSDQQLKLFQPIQDYLMVASLYGAPGERYEPTRLDFVKASFAPDADVFISIEYSAEDQEYSNVTIHYKKLNKTGQALTVNLTEMAPTLAKFCVRYRAMLKRFNGSRGNLFFLYKQKSKLFQPMTTGCYSYALADLWQRYREFLGFDMKEEAGTGCNAARHSHKRSKRGPPLTSEDQEDLKQQGHSTTTDATY